MPFIAPNFVPARPTPLDTSLPDIAGNLLNPIAKAQQINNLRLLNDIQTQLAPYRVQEADLSNQTAAFNLEKSKQEAPINEAIKKLLLAQKGIILSPQIPGRPATVPAIPLTGADMAGFQASDKPSYAPGFVGPQAPDSLAPDVRGSTGIVPPQILGNGAVYDQNTAADIAQRLFGTALAQDKLKEQQKSDIIKQRQIDVNAEKAKSFGISNTRQLTAENSIRGQYNRLPEVVNYNTVNQQYEQMKSALDYGRKSKNYVAVDQAIIDTYNRIINPRRAVLAGQYNITEKYQSAINKLDGWAQRQFQGGSNLTDADRQNIVDLSKVIHDKDKIAYDKVNDRYKKIAEDASIDPTHIIDPDYVQQMQDDGLIDEAAAVEIPATEADTAAVKSFLDEIRGK